MSGIQRRYKRRPSRLHAEIMNPRDPRWPSDEDSELDDITHPRTRLAPRRNTFRTMETVLLASTAALLAAVAWPIATRPDTPDDPPPHEVVVVQPATAQPPKIQLALLLDTSSSMDGLIDQARSQLWAVVNALDAATFEDATPRLEIAVYEYGNDGLSAQGGFIRRVVPFSSELDVVSDGLFGLTTAGGDEHAGQVIDRATRELEWDDGDHVLRVLYIAGNEEFTQGPVDFRKSVALARAQGIVVNTINCTGQGAWDAGWQDAAYIGGGKALRIDQDATQAYIPSPHDDEIETLSARLNTTYLGYGARAERAMENQTAQDANSVSAGRASSLARAMSKTSRLYDNSKWDLVDALDKGVLDLPNVDRSTLSDELAGLSDEALETKITKASKERARLKKKLRSLQEKREDYVASKRAESGDRLDDAIIDSITAQAKAAGFTL